MYIPSIKMMHHTTYVAKVYMYLVFTTVKIKQYIRSSQKKNKYLWLSSQNIYSMIII